MRAHQTPEVPRHFTAKRLDALTRLPDAAATSLFMEDVRELVPLGSDSLP